MMAVIGLWRNPVVLREVVNTVDLGNDGVGYQFLSGIYLNILPRIFIIFVFGLVRCYCIQEMEYPLFGCWGGRELLCEIDRFYVMIFQQ